MNECMHVYGLLPEINITYLLTITHLGRVSLITAGGATSSHQTLLNIGWPAQTGRTIHFDNKSHVYPSPDTLINPSTDRIHN